MLRPDYGATISSRMCVTHRSYQDRERKLRKPIRIHQGSTNVLATTTGFILTTMVDIRNQDQGSVLLAPCVLLEEFRPELLLVSTGVMRAYNILLVDPPHPHDGHMVPVDPAKHQSYPYSVSDYPSGVVMVRLQRQSNSLFGIPFFEASAFKSLYSLLSAGTLDLHADLEIIKRHEPLLRMLLSTTCPIFSSYNKKFLFFDTYRWAQNSSCGFASLVGAFSVNEHS